MKLSVLLFVALLGFAAVSEAKIGLVSGGVHRLQPGKQSVEFSFCSLCNSFISNGINQLLNAILQGGVIGGCGELCSKAFPNDSQKTEQQVCNLVCDAAGVYTFIHLVQRFSSDLDPIYFCELARACPVHDGGSARLDRLVVSPLSGPVGTTFDIDVAFTVFNQTSTGELLINIQPPRSDPFGDGELDEGFAPGQYAIKFSLQTQPSEQEAFEAGNYLVSFSACDGECGSKMPHSALLFQGAGNFTITAA